MNENDRTTETDLEAIRQRAREVELAEGRGGDRAKERRAESAKEKAQDTAKDTAKDTEREARRALDRREERPSERRPYRASSEPYGDAGKYQFGTGYLGYPGTGFFPFYAAPQASPGYAGGFPDYTAEARALRHREHEHHVFGRWDDAGDPAGHRGTSWTPRTEMFDRDGKLVVRVELPGMDRDDVDVSVEGDRLVIEGERHDETEDRPREGFYRSEWSYGFFHREIPIPEPVEHDHVKAKFKNGILEVVIPQSNRSSDRKQIRIDS